LVLVFIVTAAMARDMVLAGFFKIWLVTGLLPLLPLSYGELAG
jgi:hypothetical protein